MGITQLTIENKINLENKVYGLNSIMKIKRHYCRKCKMKRKESLMINTKIKSNNNKWIWQCKECKKR